MPKKKTSFIKIDRSILIWPFFNVPKTAHLYFYLLLKANIKDKWFMGVKIPRGSLAASRETIRAETGLSIQDQRTAGQHLVENGDVKIHRYSKFLVYEIVNFDYWQKVQDVKKRKQESIRSTNASYDLEAYEHENIFDDDC